MAASPAAESRAPSLRDGAGAAGPRLGTLAVGFALAWTGVTSVWEFLAPGAVALAVLALTPIAAAATRRAARVVAPRMACLGPRSRWVVAAATLGAGCFLVAAVPLELRPPLRHRLEVTLPRGAHGLRGVPRLFRDDARRVRWQSHVSAAGSDVLAWEGQARGPLYLRVVAQRGAGTMTLRWDGHTKVIRLEAERKHKRSLHLPVFSRVGPRGFRRAWMLIAASASAGASALALAALLLAAGVWLATRPARSRPSGGARWSWLAYAVPSVTVWTVFLVAFWPALMSPDSHEQWAQMTSWRLNNFHPAWHTLTLWLVTRPWQSPAAVATVQIAALALVLAVTLRELRAAGVPRWPLALVAVAFAASPVNGMTVITIWRDIPYAIACLGLVPLILRLVRTGGQTARRVGTSVGLVVGLLAIALYRHNGVIVAAGLGVALAGLWRRLALATVLAVIAYLVMLGPVFGALGVSPIRPAYLLSRQIQQLAAIVHSGAPLSPDERAVVTHVDPEGVWQRLYSCYSLNSIYVERMDLTYVDAHPDEVLRAWWALAPRHVPLLAGDQVLCAGSLVWRVRQPFDGWLYTIADPTADGRRSPAPRLQDVLYRWVAWSLAPPRLSWIWRPALALYVLLFCVAVGAARVRDWRFLAVGLPAVLNSLVWLLVVSSQDARYQYAVYVTGLVAPALLFVDPRTFLDSDRSRDNSSPESPSR
jgi:hypothetical protein